MPGVTAEVTIACIPIQKEPTVRRLDDHVGCR
jgi:hypothetical protein